MSQILHGQLKMMKCYSCPAMLRVDARAISCQCGTCILGEMHRPPVHHEEAPYAAQLELGEGSAS